jgi:Flp pilus assembly protein TadG
MRQRDRRWGGRIARRARRDESGASLVEFALVLPVFALLLFGLIDFGLIFGSYITMRNGVESGARSATVNNYTPPTTPNVCMGSGVSTATAEMVCTVMESIQNLQAITNSSIKVGIEFPPLTSGTTPITVGSTQDVEICAQGQMKSVTGLTGFALNGKHMSASSTVRLETNPGFGWFDSSGTQSVTYQLSSTSSTITVGAMPCS